MNTEQIPITDNPMRLPLWKNCVEEMREAGLNYGDTFKAEYFEQRLRCDRNAMIFSFAISSIRRELETDGFYLSGRGHGGDLYEILPSASNMDVMTHYSRLASTALRRGVILGTNTRLDSLSESDRRKHEQILERLAVKSVLLRRSTQVLKVIAKVNPKLLSEEAKS